MTTLDQYEATGDKHLLHEIPLHCIFCKAVMSEERLRYKALTCTPEHNRERSIAKKNAAYHGTTETAYCTVCTDPIDAERIAKNATTCSKHSGLRKRIVAASESNRRCNFCRRPSNAFERNAYKRFRKLELTRPDLLYPQAFKRWQAGGGDLAGFSAALVQSFVDKVNRGDTTPGEFDSELVDRRSKHAPGGSRAGRPKSRWKGGDDDCDHEPFYKRKGSKKELTLAKLNTCRKCGALREGAEDATAA